MPALISPFFHASTNTYSHVVADPGSKSAAIIDPVLDFDPASGRIETLFADALLAHVHEHRLQVDWILETHAHADHLSAAGYLREQLGARIGIGAGITGVQAHFKTVFGLGDDFNADGSQFDRLFAADERFSIGKLPVQVIATPGHTNDSVSYLIGDAVFVGDTVFAPDVGTARCDFPGGDARTLFESIQRLLALPEATRIFLCHDYPPAGREPRAQTSVAEQRAQNIHLAQRSAEDYVGLRQARDATLSVPRLLLPAIQVNIRGGRLPPADANGVSYLRIPLHQS